MRASMSESRSVQTLHGLLNVSKALGSEVELNSLLEVIITHASLIMEADRTTVFVYDPTTHRLWSRIGQGLEAGTIELELGSGIAGEVARSKKPINIADATGDPRFNAEFDRRSGYHTKSILCAPILSSDGSILGVIQTINKLTRDVFDEEDEHVMTALASHAAVALERANLTEAFVERNRYEEALKVASEIQLGMLPKTAPDDDPGSPFEIAALIRPAKHVGGDFYDYRRQSDGRLFFCIGDVSGKGVPAALMMAVTRTLFRANSSTLQHSDGIMAAVNRVLCEETGSSMFVSGFCALLDPESGALELTNAGHNPPILIGADGAARELTIKPGLVLGVAPGFTYASETIQLRPGESVYIYTDGISEQTNAAHEMFGVDRLCAALSRSGNSAVSLVDSAVSAVTDFSQGVAQFDDLTALCVRYRGPAAGVSPA